MSYKAITFDLNDRIATITFNRPDRLNAINEEMRDDFTRLFTELQTKRPRQRTRHRSLGLLHRDKISRCRNEVILAVLCGFARNQS